MRSNLGGLGRRWFLVGMIIAAAVIFSLVTDTTEGAHLPTSLLNSDFEIDYDANLKVDHLAGTLDWANVDEATQNEQASGSADDSFGKGTKEDTAVPALVTGSVPPNKSDLSAFGVYLEENDRGGKFMHLFWTRAQDPKGTTNMDFEFNQAAVESPGAIPARTDGDLLIEYKLAKGGTVPELYRYTWIDIGGALTASDCEASSSLPCWGGRTDLTASGDAAGSINTSAIAAVDSAGMGDLGPYTFGEASVDLKSIFDPNKCTSFGSAYLKSRSSDSFTSALKDYIAPQTVNISNCGTVIIVKETQPSYARGELAPFSFTSTVSTDPADPASGEPFFLGDGDEKTIKNVLATGLEPYLVTEDDADRLGWDLTNIYCDDDDSVGYTDSATANIFVEPGEVIICTFTNTERSNLIIEVVTEPVGSEEYFSFSLEGSSLPDTHYFEVSALGIYDVNSYGGIGWLLPGSGYSIGQTVPGGWVYESGSCDDNSPVGDIELSPGETVTCTFNYVQMGNIIIEKQTLPDGDLTTFDFAGDVAGSLSDGGSASAEVAPGTYSSTEAGTAGWDLTDITCHDDDGDSSGDTASATATFIVAAGETVKCTFTNTKRGNIVIEKQTLPDGDSTSFSFAGDVTRSLTDGQSASAEVAPGTYGSTESVPPGWELTDISCDAGGSGDTASATATFIVAAGETVKCTYTNTKLGTIVIEKQTLPDGDSTLFDFTGDVTDSLSDGQSASVEVLPGTYDSTEAGTAGWDLTDITCNDDDGDSSGDTASATATFIVAAGETVKCTFTNIKRGTIVIEKQTLPDGDSTPFDFTGDVTDSLSDGQSASAEVVPGTYSSTEEVPAGWVLSSITCDDGDSSGDITPGKATFKVDPGETVKCTFTNTKLGAIIIENQTLPNGDPTTWAFTGDLAGFLQDGEQARMVVLPGIYSSTEVMTNGWDLTDITCDDDDSSGDIASATASFIVAAGEEVTCVFTNTKLFTIITLVCHADQLYVSTVVLGNGAPVQTLAPADLGSISFNLCSLTGARFENRLTGDHSITVSILPLP